MIKERLQALRRQMDEKQIDVYFVPTSDFHESEYVGDHFKARKFITGFTGSAGTAVITKTEAGLFTDGRYFIQAAEQLKDTTITLFRIGEEGVPKLEEYVEQCLSKGQVLGFDGRVVNTKLGKQLKEMADKKEAAVCTDYDLIDTIWKDRPPLSKQPAFLLDVKYSGKSTKEKLTKLREKIKEKGATMHIITSLDDINWLFNIRGNDVENYPVVLSYAIVTLERAYLFIQDLVVSEEIKQTLYQDGVELYSYEQIYEFVKEIKEEEVILLDPAKVNYQISQSISDEIEQIEDTNPTIYMKAIKNEVELENLRKAHIKDGVAFTKFMYWLKTNIGKIPMDEISAADYLEQRRREQTDNIGLSFDTICGYNANAAMMHYKAEEESKAVLQPEGLLLVDSGGNYMQGSTDITRTMVLGAIDTEWKLHFTTVVRSMLRLANAKFLYGSRGSNLDVLSRGPIWDLDLDYKCGTGHGVGYLLNIHEGPNGFFWKIVPDRPAAAILEEGMVTTDEPGIYIEGSHGIRIENELICKKGIKNEYGQFMEFEMLTYAPIDLDGIDPTLMEKSELKYLNEYHKLVYEKLSPYLTEKEQEWLKEYTREL